MINDAPVSIAIIKKIPLFGEGDTLETRLRNVALRGFPQVRIYQHAQLETEFLPSEQIQKLHTPQPSVYESHLKRINILARLFKEKGIDILDLQKAYDFIARTESGETTEWTMIPPIVEQWLIPKTERNQLDYASLLGEEIKEYLLRSNLKLNPELASIPYTSDTGYFDLINDGTHRIHFGYLNGGIRILRIKNIAAGFPYYAAPKKYAEVQLMPEPNETTTAMKVHILESPAQKLLYRLFPTGGIKTGEVRPPTRGETFI